MDYPEELLHFIWRYRLYDPINLKTQEGEALKTIEVGLYNRNAGPDFEYALIELNGVRWKGHVEMHVDEGDWKRHGHHLDPAYSATVLHVVWRRSTEGIQRLDGTSIPTLLLRDYVQSELLQRYDELRKQERYIACEGRMSGVLDKIRPGWLTRLLIERLEEKYKRNHHWLAATKQDWERVFLIALGRAFGTNVNAAAFEELLSRIAPNLLYKYRDEPDKITALLFGVAGFLEDVCTDDYFVRLKTSYGLLRKLHNLECMAPAYWKFMRTRPYNFPTYRLAQLAAQLPVLVYGLERMRTTEDLQEWFDRMRAVQLDTYWKTHFRFGSPTKEHSAGWTDTYLHLIAINCFIPVLFSYGQFLKDETLIERALKWMEQLPPEKNAVVTYYSSQGLHCHNAADSQALLHLKNGYCESKKCLDCAVGTAILRPSG